MSYFEFVDAMRTFFSAGGEVLYFIAGLILIMWLLVLERFFYVNGVHKKMFTEAVTTWKARSDKGSWNAEQIRQAMISRITIPLNTTVPLIQALVALCPLLGLLGTVTGMIEVFDAMASVSSGDARSMASGVSKATIPTLAGMVGALSGVFATTWLNRRVKSEKNKLEQSLNIDHDTDPAKAAA